ncbi:MAG TPA: DMT family transporter [Anaerolineaceae bacterium]|jgi:transporter family-2 protein
MSTLPVILLVGLIAGASVGIQSPIAGAMGQRVGGLASSFIVHFSGMLFSAVFLIFRGGEKFQDWTKLPWYMLISGVFGVILYQCISIVLPRLGGTLMVTLIIIGQLLVNVLVDHFGWLGVATHPITPARGLGIAILLLGGYLIARF